MALNIANIRPTRPQVPNGTGSVTFDVTGSGPCGVSLARRLPDGVSFTQYLANPNTQAPLINLTVAPIPPGYYIINVFDRELQAGIRTDFILGEYESRGCTDRDAANYDPNAQQEDGSCTYTPPPVPTPIFAVPLLNSLRFVQAEIPDGCQTFQTLDNALFCKQERPGMQRRPLYFQPVCYCDPMPVQVLSNYDICDAVVHRHSDGQVLRTQLLEKKLHLQGTALPVEAQLADATGDTLLTSSSGVWPASLLNAKRLTLQLTLGGPVLNYRILRSGKATLANPFDFVVINRPWDNPPATGVITWPLTGPGFNVWEGNVDLQGLPPGDYEVRVHGYDDINLSAEATSEPFRLAETHPNTLAIDYRNTDNAFGMVFSTGITPRLRVPGTFFRQKNGGTVTQHRNSDDSLVVLASTAQRRQVVETYGLPAYAHEKLYLVFRLDAFQINGVRCQTGDPYEADEQRSYPLSAGRVTVEQKKWLGAGNSDDALPNETGDDFLVLRVGGFVKLRK
ncbi:MAG TPA: hypothetical protein VF690_13340 [Hymenobacter sp.]|jgi:hypothetical protein